MVLKFDALQPYGPTEILFWYSWIQQARGPGFAKRDPWLTRVLGLGQELMVDTSSRRCAGDHGFACEKRLADS